jgi:hypothetical protein
MGLGDGDTGADVEALLNLLLPYFLYEVSPRVEGDDLLRVEPRGLRRDAHGGLRVRVRGLVSRREGAEGNCECTIDRVGARVGADGVAHLDHVRQTRRNDGAARFGVLSTPLEIVRLDSCLVGVRCTTERVLVSVIVEYGSCGSTVAGCARIVSYDGQTTRPGVPTEVPKSPHVARRTPHAAPNELEGGHIGRAKSGGLTRQDDPLGVQHLFPILLEGLRGRSAGERARWGHAIDGCRGRRGEDLRVGEGAGETNYGRRARPVRDGDRGGPGGRRDGWRRLGGDGIELWRGEKVSWTLETTRRSGPLPGGPAGRS